MCCMKNWESYIDRQKEEYTRFRYPKELDAGIVVVIPCYNEPGLQATLHGLRACKPPAVNVLVAVIINSGVLSNNEAVNRNRITYEEVNRFATRYNESNFSFLPVLFEGLPRKHAGVGLARKIGMDLAVEHFWRNKTERGIIISLDADCLVSPNFLTSIYEAFQQDPRLGVTIHKVYHRVDEPGSKLEKQVRQYEAYLDYYRGMLKKIGFPYYYQTIGSAFAVLADPYVKVGGMGRQQGGEDFYFLHKVFEHGKAKELDDVVVYPLARYSDRVPFGTGPALQKMTGGSENTLEVYSRRSFLELKCLFDLVDAFFKQGREGVTARLHGLHPALSSYLKEIDFIGMVDDCNGNSTRLDTFRKRFFHHFNAFRIIKYLNRVHPNPFPREPISTVLSHPSSAG